MLGRVLKSVLAGSPPARAHAADPFEKRLAESVSLHLGRLENDNFDEDRWQGSREAAAAREAFYCRKTLADLLANPAPYAQAHGLFADPASQDLFVLLIAYRLLGHRHVRLPANNVAHWTIREQVKAMPCGHSPHSGLFGPLRRYELHFLGEPLVLDAWWMGIAWTFFYRQYFLERDGISVQPQPGDRVIDAGGCYGDTALAFAASVGPGGRVHSFEIDPGNAGIARHNFAGNPGLADRLALHECALTRNEQARLYRHGSGPGACVSDVPSGAPLAVATIDGLVSRGVLDRVDFIKMDIEGAERDALTGAEQTLRRFRPRLAISVYHRESDLWHIVRWLDALALGYRFHLEHYTIHHEETVLYATAGTP
jgi:FkbM family methyltransferase